MTIMKPIYNSLFFALGMACAACGQLTDSTTSGYYGSSIGTSGSDYNTPTSTTTTSTASDTYTQNKYGTYSFVYTDPLFTCSDGSVGSSQGGSMQMVFEIKSGLITMMQTSGSNSSSQQKIGSSGTRLISSTPISGTINSSGAFVATSTALFDDSTFGYMRVSYKLDGKMSGSTWSGKYDTNVYFEELYASCIYKSTFTGSSTN